MTNTAFEFVPEQIVPKLAKLKPYVLLILKKGENYGFSDTPRIIQSEHLPYVFKQREEDGIMVLTMPIIDNTTEFTAIAIYNTTDKEKVRELVEKDPAVMAGIFD